MASRDPQMRAAEADREQVAARLRAALDEGRLTLDEYDDRLRAVYQAKTFGELDQVVSDLPAPAAAERSQLAETGQPVPPSRVEESPGLAPWLAWLWRLWLVVVLINLVIWFVVTIAAGELIYFWPIWVAGPWGAVNVGLTVMFPPNRRRR